MFGRILNKNLHFHGYKFQLAQELMPTEDQCNNFANWLFEHDAEKIITSIKRCSFSNCKAVQEHSDQKFCI